jgi:hypothetical protein
MQIYTIPCFGGKHEGISIQRDHPIIVIKEITRTTETVSSDPNLLPHRF